MGEIIDTLNTRRGDSDGYERRETLALLRRANRLGWNVSQEIRLNAPEVVWQLCKESSDPRDKINAIRALVSMESQNVAIAIEADRADRPKPPKVVNNNNTINVQRMVLSDRPANIELPRLGESAKT